MEARLRRIQIIDVKMAELLRAKTEAERFAMIDRSWRFARQMIQANTDIDVRALLPSISAPTLVLHTEADPIIWPSVNRYLGEHIPGARIVELPGDYHCSWRLDDIDAVMVASESPG